MIVIIWVTAYSFCLFSVFTGIMTWKKCRNPAVPALCAVLLTMGILSLYNILYISAGLHKPLILTNISVLIFLTVIWFITASIRMVLTSRQKVLGAFVIVLTGNLLYLTALYRKTNFQIVFFVSILIFFSVFNFVFFIRQHRKQKSAAQNQIISKPPNPLNFRHDIRSCGILLGITSGLFSIFPVLLSALITLPDWFYTVHYAVFTVGYNVPPLLYFLTSLKNDPDLPSGGTVSFRSLGLTPRQCEIARLLTSGSKYSEIADQLYISVSTVKKHVYDIYRKAEVTNSRQLMQKALQSK